MKERQKERRKKRKKGERKVKMEGKVLYFVRTPRSGFSQLILLALLRPRPLALRSEDCTDVFKSSQIPKSFKKDSTAVTEHHFLRVLESLPKTEKK